ncbi:galactose-binding domain-containing protein [Formosa haliotis]|uniref:galactose-binding domain-containing protein n=1 Tax=Formosa haliotis TaxID=1555194 RepID=UPI000824E963|nr:T9SS type A sorting domain-containing protein [Formosa haliotis]
MTYLKKLKWLTTLMVVLMSYYSKGYSQTQVVVNSLSEFHSVVQNSDQEIILAPGDYELDDLPSDSRVINCSGSNNTIDMTGVRIKTLVGSIRESYFIISGNDNIVKNGAIEDYYSSGLTEVTDYSAYNNDPALAYGLKGAAVMRISGNNNQLLDFELIIRGSYPYGYGSIYGIGSDRTFNHSKRCGIVINGLEGGGNGNTLDGITMYHYAFGHGIFIQNGAGNNLIKNCYVEGRMRPSADLYNDTETYDYPYRSNYEIAAPGTPFAMPFESPIPIPMDVMYPLSEDGIRSYGGTGAVTVENCTVKNMRGGVRTYLASSATVTNCTSIGNGLTNFNVNSGGQVSESTGDFTYAPIMDVPLDRSGQNIELTIMPSPDAIGPHNIADIDGNNHKITFHRTEGPLDSDEERAIVITGNNSTIVNETEYKIILESTASGNTIISCGGGEIIDNGSLNTITESENCKLPVNLATKYGTATQSTDYESHGSASNAIDGNTNSTWGGRSLSHTSGNATLDPEPWWQVDLSANYQIETIKIYNRTDCCSDRLNNFTVEVIDSNGAVAFSQFYETAPSNAFTITTGDAIGGIVKISKTTSDALALAEVEIFGEDAEVTLSDKTFELSQIKLYPNPANDILNIANAKGEMVSVYSILGKQVLTTKLEHANETIDISGLNTGIYFAEFKIGTTRKIIKLIKK